MWSSTSLLWLLTACAPAPYATAQQPPQYATIDSGAGLQWRFVSRSPGSWALGQPILNGSGPIEQPVDDAIAYWRRESDELVVPVLASALTIEEGNKSALLSGSAQLSSSITGSVSLRISLEAGAPAAHMQLAFSTSTATSGWQLCVKWMHDGPADAWRAQGYPIAGNSTRIDGAKLQYMGFPGFLLYRPNASNRALAYWGLAVGDDYSNPSTWTGATQFTFHGVESGDGWMVAPQFLFGGGGTGALVVYEATMQLVFARASTIAADTLAAVREIVPSLLRLNSYAVEPMPSIRSTNDSLACFVNARRMTPMWKNTPAGAAYQLQDIASFIYLGTTPESAFFEYTLWQRTNETLWRTRALSQMEFWMRGQNVSGAPGSRHYGVVATAYELPAGPFDSTDRGTNVGLKIDINAHMARYALLLWEAVLTTEGVNQTTWYAAAQHAAEWVYRMGVAQAGGGQCGSAGFPQKIDTSDAPSPSVASGRTMNALPVFARLLGDTHSVNYTSARVAAEAWMVANIEGLLFFSAQHPDLGWDDFEQDSVWELIEYWLDQADAAASRGDAPRAGVALDRALGDAYVALLMLCPKQLSWVTNPTQMAADEQEMYHQYTVYTYHNRKWSVLERIAAATGDALWQQLADRLFQLNMFTQVTAGAADDLGGFHEAISDPWNARGGGVNFMGSVYLNELALDLSLQLLLAGALPTTGYTGCKVTGGGN